MGKRLFIAEKPSVAQEFARVLHVEGTRHDGYLESADTVVTWCVGHLVKLSYPDAYDPSYKQWRFDTIPFIPTDWKYEVIDNVRKQFQIVAGLLNREDVDTIYVCTDSGREGEYIYRLVSQEAKVRGKKEKRVWIDSQTEEEINRGIREAKDLSAYDALAAAAYLRAKEDYLMGINFSRALTLKFGRSLSAALHTGHESISIGRVMTCVLGMVVRREREIRDFTETPFFRLVAALDRDGHSLQAEWHVTGDSRYYESPKLYNEKGFRKREDAEAFRTFLTGNYTSLLVEKTEKKTEKKKPPLLFNLAELQNECAKRFKISPDTALNVTQELYEKKLVTYPRTDARVLSTAIAKEIHRNIAGLLKVSSVMPYAQTVLDKKSYTNIEKTAYVDDSKITDHYAIIPTGQGLGALAGLSTIARNVYEVICRRFLSIFYPAAVYEKWTLECAAEKEHFFQNFKFLKDEGYLALWHEKSRDTGKTEKSGEDGENEEETVEDSDLASILAGLKKGTSLSLTDIGIKEGKTTPPKRYNSGSLILAMENAGQLIEDEELRSQIKGSGIGTSATRAEILKKLVTIAYLHLHPKTQVVTPTLKGELNFEVVLASMPQMLNPELTASWEKGLTGVAEGKITESEYMEKLAGFVQSRTNRVKEIRSPEQIQSVFQKVQTIYAAKK